MGIVYYHIIENQILYHLVGIREPTRLTHYRLAAIYFEGAKDICGNTFK